MEKIMGREIEEVKRREEVARIMCILHRVSALREDATSDETRHRKP
jgi:hypothetical protein